MRVKLVTVILAAYASMALTSGAASANVTFYPFGVGAPTLTQITNFSADAVNSAPTYAPLGWSWSGSGFVLDKSTSVGAKPAVEPGQTPFANFLTVSKGNAETLSIPASANIEVLNIYAGSLDTFNNLTFGFSDGSSQSYSGITLASLTTAVDDGNQFSGSSNGIFNFKFAKPARSCGHLA